MTVREWLIEHKSTYDIGMPIELKDVIDGRGIYCGGYKQMMSELNESGVEHIANARFIYEDFEKENNCIVLMFMKDTNEYSRQSLEDVARKVNDKRYIYLTNDQIDCFNAYIEDAKMDVAFGNSDWRSIYHKIVGDRISDYAKEKMDRYFAHEE